MALAKTLTDIANLSLASLGEDIIQSIDGTNDPERIVRNNISEVIRQVQLIIHWPELLKKISPTQSSTVYSTTEYNYILPGDFLEVVKVQDSSGCEIVGWFLENGFLVTDHTAPVLTYKKYSEDVSAWSGRLVETIYRKLSLEIALHLTDNVNMMKTAEMMYEKCKSEALSKTQSRTRNYKLNRRSFGYQQYRRNGAVSRPIGYR